MQDKRSKGYLFRTRKSSGGQVRNRKGGYLFRTRKDGGGEFDKRAEYLFRTRRTPYTAGKRQGSYLFRTRGGYPLEIKRPLELLMSRDEKFPGKLCINGSMINIKV